MKVAVIQMNAGHDKNRNVQLAYELSTQAIAAGAQFVLLPEVFTFRGRIAENREILGEKIPGESSAPFMELARKHGAHILLGSLYEAVQGEKKLYNTSVLINAQGNIEATYRKQHLFCVKLIDKEINEGNDFVAGSESKTANVGEFKCGLSICYDLRFPELYRKYAREGVDVICVPSAFTYATGQAHWEVLLRARAIENQAYVLAPNQYGYDEKGGRCYGNSMIISPWGEVIARAGDDEETILYCDLSKGEIERKRAILPALTHMRKI